MGMKELTMVMDLTCQIRVLFTRGLEHDLDLLARPDFVPMVPTFGAIGELV